MYQRPVLHHPLSLTRDSGNTVQLPMCQCRSALTAQRSSQGISSAQLYDMLPAIPRDTLMGVINEMLKHNRLDVFRPKPGVALFKEFPHGEGLKCARKRS